MDLSPRLNKILYHLGKGIWKGVPVVGPIVEELVYEANKDRLLQDANDSCASLSDEDLIAIDAALQRIESTSESAAKEVQSQLTGIADALGNVETNIREDLSTIMTVLRSLQQVQSELSDDDKHGRKALQQQIDAMQMRRKESISRLSQNQRELLACVPSTQQTGERRRPIFRAAKAAVGKFSEARYEEMNMRLHELRWLGLIARNRRQVDDHDRDSDWFYWRTRDGSLLVSETPA